MNRKLLILIFYMLLKFEAYSRKSLKDKVI
jgi:hypothetical protein